MLALAWSAPAEAGWRLRLSARAAGVALDHGRSLRVRDGLVTRPSAVAPLRLEAALRDGDPAAVTLGPDVVPALQALPLTGGPGD